MNKVDETQPWCPSVQGISEKEQWLLPALLSGRELPPSFPTLPNPHPSVSVLKPDNLVAPLMSLVPSKLLPQCWSSERVSSS